ncbi:hypothetical protein, partial [Cupriavidus basilensis]|uniref:hypothetical protein n=1 Tax=Cupriavidus basilensis TaxID=68895 RepID=UPI000A448E45
LGIPTTQAGETALPGGTLVGPGGDWIINPDTAQAAPLAAPTLAHQVAAHPIKEPYTLAEIEARIASHDYSAELLLQHAMELLRGRPGEDARPVAWRAWFDQDSGARWLFTLWPKEERLDVQWQPLYATQGASHAGNPG